MKVSDLTFYVEDAAFYRMHMASRQADRGSFDKKIAQCDISLCRGMCCYQGVYLSDSAATRVREIAATYGNALRDLGVPDCEMLEPCPASEPDYVWKTATRPREFSKIVEDYPATFEDTCCVFLLDDGRCSLQALSIQEGRHPWYFKPMTCWRHPMVISERPGIGLEIPPEPSAEQPVTDPDEIYLATIRCGQARQCGQPAAQVLTQEIECMSAIIGRPLLGDGGSNA